MKNKIYLMLMVSALAVACVDDYTDANPAPRKDAPVIRVNSSTANQVVIPQPVNAFQNDYEGYVEYGQPVEYTVTVVRAPGGVGNITVSASVPDFGSVALDEASVAAIQGQESGAFKFTFTPNPDLPADEDRGLNLVVTVSDTQVDEDGEAAPKTTQLTLPVTLVDGPCLTTGLAGTYRVIEASGNLDGGETYNLDTLKKYMGTMNVLVEIDETRPGLYRIDEVTAGVWPVFYSGRANPRLRVDLCGESITGHTGQVTTGAGTAAARTFTLNGTLNNDGTITMSWSYVRDDGSTPENPAQGTYVLAPH